MNYDNIEALVLAAGKGSRMNSNIPKCCTLLNGKPLITYTIDKLNNIGINKIITVISEDNNRVKEILKDRTRYSIQKEISGTAKAVISAEKQIKEEIVLITLADMPLISERTFQGIIDYYYESKADLVFATYIRKEEDNIAKFYGRVIEKDKSIYIQEVKDCNKEELMVKEVNVSLYITKKDVLFKNIYEITNNNKQNEYYLTDIIKIYNKNNYTIKKYQINNSLEIMGINTKEQLQELEKIVEEENEIKGKKNNNNW